MRDWCRSNLENYWLQWIKSARTRPARIAYSLTDSGITWGVLGVVRLHATIYTGDVISKSKAAEYALNSFASKWENIIWTFDKKVRIEAQ